MREIGSTAGATCDNKSVYKKGRKTMTRAEIVKLFPTATEEQITALLNQHQSELQAEKDKQKDLKGNADKVKELEAQLEELQNKDISDSEKMQKQIDKLQSDYDNAQKIIRNMELKSNLQKQGLSDEEADNFINSLNGDTFDASVLGTIIKNAVSAKEKELMDNAPNPMGGDVDTDNKNEAEEQMAKDIAQSIAGSSKNSADIVNAYA